MRILLTGGHFSPAYSLIEELKRRGHEVAIAGRKYSFEGDDAKSLEYIISQNENLSFYEIKTGRLQRKLTGKTIPSLLKIPGGLSSASKAIRDFKPDVVVTFGGYIALPVALASFIRGIPIILHEQTQSAGLSSRLIGRIASRVCVSFEGSKRHFKKGKAILTGNPLRKNVLGVDKKIPLPDGKLIFVTGGSTGSHNINVVIERILPQLLEDFVVLHQTGDSQEFKDFDKLEDLREKLPDRLKEKYVLRKFIYPDEIGFVLDRATLVVARAGINTVLEVLATDNVGLFIPLSHGQTGEQLENAKLVKRLSVGEYIEEKDINDNVVLEKIHEMVSKKSEYEKNFEGKKEVIFEDATERIVDVIEEYEKK